MDLVWIRTVCADAVVDCYTVQILDALVYIYVTSNGDFWIYECYRKLILKLLLEHPNPKLREINYVTFTGPNV
jgi:hypothetical protein